MSKKWVMANWKMHGSQVMVRDYIDALIKQDLNPKTELVVFPPAVYLDLFSQYLAQGKFSLGAQNTASEAIGAFTGEISASMLREFACRYVLVGHSERRQIFHEDNEIVAKKFYITQEHDMIPVLCIGESYDDYQAKRTKEVLTEQLLSLKKKADFSFEKCIIAYEPLWAIGSGLIPSAGELDTVFHDLNEIIYSIQPKVNKLPMLYGGSVNEKNIEMFAKMELCQGVLVGGASLKTTSLMDIIKCITYC